MERREGCERERGTARVTERVRALENGQQKERKSAREREREYWPSGLYSSSSRNYCMHSRAGPPR